MFCFVVVLAALGAVADAESEPPMGPPPDSWTLAPEGSGVDIDYRIGEFELQMAVQKDEIEKYYLRVVTYGDVGDDSNEFAGAIEIKKDDVWLVALSSHSQ